MPKYNDFDLDLQNSSDESTEWLYAKVSDSCPSNYSGKPWCRVFLCCDC